MNLFGSSSAKPGQAAPRPASPAKLKRVNLEKRFTILLEHGQGSMSRVYKAVDKESGKVVCLKVQDKEKSDEAAARAAREHRPPEGEIGLQIVHPNVVRTLEFGATPRGEHFLVMEFVDGVPMHHLRSTRAPLSLAEKVDLLVQAAEALAAVHQAGFIHHDFGPKNLLVDRENRLKLIDFGLSVPNTAEFHRPGNRTGTLNYMAPELLRRESTDQRLDIFSFGVTAYEFLTGRLPYEAATSMEMMLRRINTPPLDIAKADPRLPEDLCAVVRKLMERSPRDRFGSMVEVSSALRELPSVAAARPPAEPERDPNVPLSAEEAQQADDFLSTLGIADSGPEGSVDDADGFLESLGVTPSPEAEHPMEPEAPEKEPDPGTRPAVGRKEPEAGRPVPELPREIRDAVWTRDRGVCAECEGRENLKFKHLVPVAPGGTDTVDNLRLLCKPCRQKMRTERRSEPGRPA